MNWAIKIISKTLMIKISHISWGVMTKGLWQRDYDKGFYGNLFIITVTKYTILYHLQYTKNFLYLLLQ